MSDLFVEKFVQNASGGYRLQEDGAALIATNVADLGAAANAAWADGVTVVRLLPGTYTVGTTIVIPGNKSLVGSGMDATILSVSTGLTAVRLASRTGVRDLKVEFAGSSPSNKGLEAGDGTASAGNWHIERVQCIGYATTGTGIHLRGGLKGTLIGCVVERFSVGIGHGKATTGPVASNANLIAGNKIRENTTGIAVLENEGADDILLFGNTIESNQKGFDDQGFNVAVFSHGNHWENDGGATPTNVLVSGNGDMISFVAEAFGGAASNRDIVVNGGGALVAATSCRINNGVTATTSGNLFLFQCRASSGAVSKNVSGGASIHDYQRDRVWAISGADATADFFWTPGANLDLKAGLKVNGTQVLQSDATVVASQLPLATTASRGAVLKSAALTAGASAQLTDSTGGSRDDVVEAMPALQAAPTGMVAGERTAINNNFSEIVEELNKLRSRVEDLVAKLQAAGIQM